MANIIDVISETVNLKREGREWYGLCPFHSDHKPSLAVDPMGTWKCRGCGAHGNVYDWLMKRDNIEFAEAKRRLGNNNVSAGNNGGQNQA
jgi:DNA primase